MISKYVAAILLRDATAKRPGRAESRASDRPGTDPRVADSPAALDPGTVQPVPVPSRALIVNRTGGASPRRAPSALSPLPPRIRRRVLVVEDDAAVVRTIARMLADYDVAIDVASDVADARQHAVLADAVLCDVHLAGESGIDLVRKLRREQFVRPIIMISGDRSRATVLACLDSGADDYLVKPFDRSLLVEKLRRRGLPINARASSPGR